MKNNLCGKATKDHNDAELNPGHGGTRGKGFISYLGITSGKKCILLKRK